MSVVGGAGPVVVLAKHVESESDCLTGLHVLPGSWPWEAAPYSDGHNSRTNQLMATN